MLTRCPSCTTTFRITPEQLKAKQGRVRCGHCQTVFNAIETLAEAAAPAVSRDIDTGIGVSPAPTFIATAPGATPPTDAPPPPEPITVVTEQETAAPQPESLADYEPSFDTLLAETEPPLHWPWALGATFALLGLAAQAGYYFRTEIGMRVPEAKPVLEEICAALGCEVALPRKADLIGIETSDLHPEPTRLGQLQLAASLKNRAPFAQAYPHLELTLTDTADKAVVRRVLAPADYLSKAKPTAPGFAAGSDLAISLALEVKGAAPAGYRLYVFYP